MVWLFQESNQRHLCKRSKYWYKSKESRNTLIFRLVKLGQASAAGETVPKKSDLNLFTLWIFWQSSWREGNLTFLKKNQIQKLYSVRCGYFNLMFLNKRNKGTHFKYCLNNKTDINTWSKNSWIQQLGSIECCNRK